MDLLKAAESGSLKDVEDAMESQGIYTDYEALNTALSNGNTDIAKFLISKNCRVNKSTSLEFESTPLHKAVELKDVDLVKLLLERKASVTAVTEGRNTPLHLAFIAGLNEIGNLLLDYINENSDVENCKNDFGLSHLHIACTTDNIKVIEKYLKANVNIEDAVSNDSPKWAGYTAYCFATKYRSLAALYYLSGSRLHSQGMQKDKDGQSPCDLAYSRLVQYSIMTHIMAEHQSSLGSGKKSYYFQGQSNMPKCEYVDQPTAFHVACMRDDSHLVEVFLDHGAPVNIPVSKEANMCPLYSPLHFAVDSGCQKNVELLVEHGADLTWTNGHRMTALHLAMYNNKRGCISDVTSLLYSKVENKEANPTDNNRLSYFHIAVSMSDLELVKKMLETKQVDVNSQVLTNSRGFSLYTPLHFAVRFGNKGMVKLLVEHGADLNVASSHGTVLRIGFFHTNLYDPGNMFELLLDLNATAEAAAGTKTLIHGIIFKAIGVESDNRDPTNVYENSPRFLLDYMERLIELGCDVNARDERGKTALHYASYRSNACTKRLLENGADVNVEDNEGHCAALFPPSYFCEPHDDQAVMYEHLLNLKALGRTINPKLEEVCRERVREWLDAGYYNEDHENCANYREDSMSYASERRTRGIELMKDEELDEKTTLYDFMRLKDEDTGAYASNEELKSIVEPESERKFGRFGYLIRLQYRRSQENARQNPVDQVDADAGKGLRKRDRQGKFVSS